MTHTDELADRMQTAAHVFARPLPILDGFAAARTLRRMEAERGLARTPILFFTANAMPEHRQQAAEVGGDGFVAKPVTPEDLLNGINSVLDRSAEIIVFE